MKKIKVNLDKKLANSYDICIGKSIIDRAALIMTKSNWASRYILISDSNVAALHGERVMEVLRQSGLKADLIDFPAGEGSKTIDTVLQIAHRLVGMGIDRKCGLIALGGGVVGDITGFVASIYMRSIPYVQIATSLLAMVDAAIGGKTGIDFDAGKNMLGTFYQPKAVFIDVDFLSTLPEAEFRTGLSEVIKYGIIDDAELFQTLEKERTVLGRHNPELLERVIAKAGRIKKGIVEIDENERGLRRILNFGHTIGHAIEAKSGYTVSHGEAVAVGMIGSALLSEKLKYLLPDNRRRIEALIASSGLPTRLPPGMKPEDVLSGLKMDKKKEGNKIHFVLVKKIGVPFINGGVPEPLIRETLQEISL
jgi:3-dehydroquinate synthase